MNTYIFRKWILLLTLLLLFLIFFFLHLDRYLSLNVFEHYQLALQQWTHTHYKLAVLFYTVSFIIIVACAIPGGLVLTFIGGFLFGMTAVLYALFSTTIGGVILFFAVRTSLGTYIKAKSSGWIKKLEHGFQQNAFSYLFILRLVPIFPCWVCNISAGALNVPFKIFIQATILGLLPGTFILVAVGYQLEYLLQTHIQHSLISMRIPM